MKFKGTLWLTVVFLGLFLFYYFVDIPSEKKEREAREKAERILLFDPADVNRFSLKNNEQTITLNRASGRNWELLEPVQAKADSDAAVSLLNRLSTLRFTRVVEESPPDLTLFGLKTPSLTVTLDLKNGDRKILQVGDKNPLGSSLYVKRGEENSVLLASASRGELIKSVYNLRDKTILDFSVSDITQVEIHREGSLLVMTKAGESWELKEKDSARGDESEIENFLNTVRAGRVQEFIEETPESLEPYGLSTPRIQLMLKSRDEKALSLLIGSQKDERSYYGKTGRGSNVFALNTRLMETLSSRMVDFMDKTLVDIDQEKIEKLELRTGEETIRIVRDKHDSNSWSILSPIQSKASIATINSLLFDLKEARIEEFVKIRVTDPKPFGLDSPGKILTIQETEKAAWSFKLGHSTADGKFLFGTRTGESAVFSIHKDTVEKIFRSLHDLRNRTLFDFESEEVRQIHLRYPDLTLELEGKGEEWDLTEPERIKNIRAFIAKDILWTLGSLEFESIVDPRPEDSVAGFDQPAATISLFGENHKPLLELSIGKPVEGLPQYYARKDADPNVYLIKKRILEELPNNINKFNN